ncbi:MAG: DedA family protein [Planctomycetes bacterium]|nr:DedA family protein [Planctomycetota bacterium]MCB9934154.1 DedA family protein [Planctomycetota bacterium]
MLPLLQTLLTASAEAAGESGWLQTVYATLFDPAWNQEHASTIWLVITGVLVLTGIGLPTPEDIWLTLAGFSAYKQAGDQFVWYYFAGAFAATTVAILIGDTGAWWLGRRFGFGIRDRVKIMRKLLTEKRLRRVQGWFDNYGSWTVFLGRQVAGVRFVTFFSAGTMRMSWWRFMLFDFLGCLVSIPLWLTLGGLASIYGREWLEKASRTVGGGMLAAAVAALVVFVIVVKVRSAKRAKKDAEDIEAEIRLSARGEATPPESM